MGIADREEARARVAARKPTPPPRTVPPRNLIPSPETVNALDIYRRSVTPSGMGLRTPAPAPQTQPSTQPRTTAPAAPANTAGLMAQLMPRTPMGSSSNVAELRAMYAKALQELQRQQTQSGETIAESIARMQSDPMNTANAYANLQAVAPTVAANPIAEYAASAGISPGMAEEAQRMATADADAYRAAVENLNQTMRTSQDVANQSRMADIGLIETGSRQDLANQANMLNLLLKQQELSGVSALQQRNLENEMAMRNALTSQISSIFSGQDVAPESILKLIEATMAKLNMARWQ
jgi:hypothetical protein